MQNLKVTWCSSCDLFVVVFFYFEGELTGKKVSFPSNYLMHVPKTFGKKTNNIYFVSQKYSQTFHIRSFLFVVEWLYCIAVVDVFFILNEIKVVTFTKILCHLSVLYLVSHGSGSNENARNLDKKLPGK